MHLRQTLRLGLTAAALCALGIVPRPAAAQALLYTLSGVTFSDGATASGSFVFDPTANNFGAYDITTTNGVTDSLAGYHYVPGTAFPGGEGFSFQFADGDPYHSPGGEQYLELITTGEPYPGAVTPGTYALQPGQFNPPGYPFPDGSAEYTSTVGTVGFAPATPRTISGGFLIVTSDSPVPEASTTVSFSLLLALGLGGAAVAAKRKKQAV